MKAGENEDKDDEIGERYEQDKKRDGEEGERKEEK